MNTFAVLVLQSDDSAAQAAMLAAIGTFWLLFLVIGLLIAAFLIYCFWRILEKAGYPGALALLNLIPLGHVVLLIWFAFAEWPTLQRAHTNTQAMTAVR
jgi:hypothetical protein